MKDYTTILWDVDGTLLDFLYSQRIAITKCFRLYGKEITEEQLQRYSQINEGYWKRLELGEVTKEQLLIGRFRTFFEECRIEGIDAGAFRDAYEEELGNVYAFVDGAEEVCRTLHGKVKQYVITNGVTRIQQNKLKLSGLDKLMDGVFISQEVGTPKPQKAFFDFCLEHIAEKDRSKILIVGDSLSSDIKGGVLAGIPTCWFRPENTVNDTPYQPDYEIDSLHRILDIISV